MADIAPTLLYDISVFQVGTDKYEGIRGANIQINDPELLTHREEGDKYASVMEVTFTEEFPVMIGIVTRDVAQALNLIALAAATVIITGKTSGGGTLTATITGGKFRRPRMSWDTSPRNWGTTNLELVAVSADGSALPIAFS